MGSTNTAITIAKPLLNTVVVVVVVFVCDTIFYLLIKRSSLFTEHVIRVDDTSLSDHTGVDLTETGSWQVDQSGRTHM